MYEIPMLAGMGSSRGLECFVQMLFVDCARYTKCLTSLMAILMPSGDAVTVTSAVGAPHWEVSARVPRSGGEGSISLWRNRVETFSQSPRLLCYWTIPPN
jgi:hypothetical protein